MMKKMVLLLFSRIKAKANKQDHLSHTKLEPNYIEHKYNNGILCSLSRDIQDMKIECSISSNIEHKKFNTTYNFNDEVGLNCAWDFFHNRNDCEEIINSIIRK